MTQVINNRYETGEWPKDFIEVRNEEVLRRVNEKRSVPHTIKRGTAN
jgi:hypothetical protein